MESLKLVELISRIDAALSADRPVDAARLVLGNLDRLDDPTPLREWGARILVDGHRLDDARRILSKAGRHWAHAGHPARSLAALCRLARLDGDVAPLYDLFTELYRAGSDALDPTARHGGIDAPDHLDLDGDEGPEVRIHDYLDRLAEACLQRSPDLEQADTDPDDGGLPPMPLLSQMPRDALGATIRRLSLWSGDAMAPLLEEGQVPDTLVWTVSPDITLGETDPTYRLPSGALVGLGGFTRPQRPLPEDVVGRHASEALMLGGSDIDALDERFPTYRERIEHLARHAFMGALMERHGLFEAIPADRRRDLLGAFDGIELEADTRIIEQDGRSPGLFLLLEGSADMVRRDEDWEITIETLEPGDVFGEIGIVSERPPQADILTNEPSRFLFLPEGDFDATAADFPTLAKYTVKLAQRRLEDVDSTISSTDLSEISED